MTEVKPIVLQRAFFFGRTLEDYVATFNLDLKALKGKRILDCPGGPSSFAYSAAALGIDVVACDSLYKHSGGELREFINLDAKVAEAAIAREPKQFHPDMVPVSERVKAMELFIQDFPGGRVSGRYVPARLPHLPFADGSFDLVLSGNLLFLYADISIGNVTNPTRLDYEFHSKSIAELVRVSRNEVRIYPVIGSTFKEHDYLPRIMNELSSRGCEAELMPVHHRELISAENMLRINCKN